MSEQRVKVIGGSKQPEIPQVVAYVLENPKTKTMTTKWKGSLEFDNIHRDLVSRQIPSEQWNYSADKVYAPRYDVESLIRCLEMSTVHYRCVRTKAYDVTGGWLIRPKKGYEETAKEEEQLKLEEFFSTCGGTETFLEVLERAMVDFESIGYGGFEIGRNREGEPQSIWHIPAATFRFMKDNLRVLQIRGQKKRYFLKFPEKYNIETKEWLLIDPVTGLRMDGDPNMAANEVMSFINYQPQSERYGGPDFIPAIGAIAGNIHARDYNLNEFTESMMPAYAVLVSGGHVSPEVQKLIESYFEDIRANKRDTLVISVPGKNVSVTIQKLAGDITDQSFSQYIKNNRDEIMLAHGMHPARIGIIETAQLGSGSGMSQLIHYKSGVIEPRQRWLEHRINNLLIVKGFGIKEWEFAFVDLDIKDKVQEAHILTQYVNAKIITIDEARAQLGLPPLSESQKNELAEQEAAGAASAPPEEAGVAEPVMLSFKAMPGELKAELYRKSMKQSLQNAWNKSIPSKLDEESIQDAKEKMREKLLGVADMVFPGVIEDFAAEVGAEYGVELDDEDLEKIKQELVNLYSDYIDSGWLMDYGDELAIAASMEEDQINEALQKTKERMKSRSGLYAGLIYTLLGMVTKAAAEKSEKWILWKNRDQNACPDCAALEAQGPIDPMELKQFPGDGHTQCHGNCRCVVELVDKPKEE